MAFGKNIQFNFSTNNLGTPQPGSDYISGILFKASTIPSAFTSGVPLKIFSVSQAESLGILGDYSDETKATATYTISGTATAGFTLGLSIIEPNINSTTSSVALASYTVPTGVTLSSNEYANKIAIAVNTGSSGYTAATGSSTVTISARSGLGAFINSTAITKSGTGATLLSGATFSGGVSSVRKLENYQISEFFRNNINGALWVAYTTTTFNWDLIQSIQTQTGGEIRQLGVYNDSATSNSTITSDLDAIQASCLIAANNYMPLSVIYAPNIYAYTDLSLLPNLRTRSDHFVSCVIGQDGSALGAYLSVYASKSVPSYGAVLGLLSKAPVSDNIGWVGKYPITTGAELSVPALSNKQLYASVYASQYALLDQLNNSGYIFLMTRPGISGTWVNDTPTAISISNDLNYIERVRTIYKVMRESYTALVPLVNSALLLNEDGTLAPSTIEVFRNSQAPNLDNMVRNAEISAYSIIIDPAQNVQTTSTINIIVRIVGIGVARNIVVDLGYALSI